MKKLTNTFLVALVVALTASAAVAQPGDRGPGDRGPGDRGPGGFRFPPNPLIVALDADKNGEISADEIKNAAEALKQLDKNNDGKLTRDELRPQFGPRPDGPPRREGDGPRPPRGEGDRPDFAQGVLERNDANKDGKISKEEASERMKPRFDEIDANKDGFVDKEELTKLFESFRDRRPEGRPDGEGRPRRPDGEGGDRPQRPRRPDQPDEA